MRKGKATICSPNKTNEWKNIAILIFRYIKTLAWVYIFMTSTK